MKIYYCLISALASLIFLDGRCDAQEKGTIPLSELARKVFEEKRVDLAEATARPVEVELNALREECLERLANGQEPQKRVAARLLGVLRSEKAIDLLIANITLANPLQTGSGVPGIEGIQDYPACAALLYIRGPNVIAAVRKARANTAEGSLERRLFDRLLDSLAPKE